MSAEKIYWDSDAFLGWLKEDEGKVELCRHTLDRAKNGEVLIVTSTLGIAESLWLRGQSKIPKDRAELVRKFFRRSYIRTYNVTRNIAEDAQDLVWDFEIAPKDAIHVATALALKIPVLETFDRKLIAKSNHFEGLTIRKPLPPKQGTLDYDR